MNEIAIRVSNFSKSFRITETSSRQMAKRTLRETLTDAFRPSARSSKTTSEFWALRDINFDVPRGKVVGLIGRNGAGKSTLLKILSRISQPTTGFAEIHGKVNSLLEVGTGFHPELTGRENVFLNGAVLGMKRHEIVGQFDEIVAFAEVERFIDTPVKHYSSGMYVRLGFAVAAHLQPDILIVDEVLAVGDVAFQQKCLGKIGEVSEQGRTVILVTHRLSTIQSLCDSAILLDEGQLKTHSTPSDAIAIYLSSFRQAGDAADWTAGEDAVNSGTIRFLSASITTASGERGPAFDAHDDLCFQIEYQVVEEVVGSAITLQLGHAGSIITTTFDTDQDATLLSRRPPGSYRIYVRLPGGYLRSGTYDLTLMSHIVNRKVLEKIEQALSFRIETDERTTTYSSSLPGRPGIVTLPFKWETGHE